MSALASVVPDTAELSSNEIADSGLEVGPGDRAEDRMICTFGPCNAALGILIGAGAVFLWDTGGEGDWKIWIISKSVEDTGLVDSQRDVLH